MGSEDRVIKHRQDRYEIVEDAKRFLPIDNPQITIDEMSVLINRHIKQRFPDKETAEAKAFIADYYGDLLDRIEKWLQEDIEIENVSHVPDYIQKLIDAGVVYPDGKRATGKLDDIVVEFRKMKIPVRARFLKRMFLQDSGKEWSDSAIDKALELLNE